jgi:hypothetical protein
MLNPNSSSLLSVQLSKRDEEVGLLTVNSDGGLGLGVDGSSSSNSINIGRITGASLLVDATETVDPTRKRKIIRIHKRACLLRKIIKVSSWSYALFISVVKSINKIVPIQIDDRLKLINSPSNS